MNNYGFVRVSAVSPSLRVADCAYNTDEIIKAIDEAIRMEISVVVFPEMCITSYTAADLFFQRALLDRALESLSEICRKFEQSDIIAIVGMPFEVSNKLYNVGVVVCKGRILGVVPKTFLPNYNEFYEKRWFASANELKQDTVEICNQQVPVGTDLIFETKAMRFALEICEDLWTPIPPSSIHTLHGADVVFNLSASNEVVGKHLYRRDLVIQQSARCICGYVYASAGNGESTTDVVYAGSCMIAENGFLLAESDRFSFDTQRLVSEIDVERLRNDRLKNMSYTTAEYTGIIQAQYRHIAIDALPCDKNTEFALTRNITRMPFVPSVDTLNERCSEIFSIQTGGLAKRLLHTTVKTAVIGVSGGLDSTLALLVLAKTFDRLQIAKQNIFGITMPGFGTTDRTYNNAIDLMKSLGVTVVEIPIRDAVNQHFRDIDHNPDVHDITYENSQARERTQILMDYANKVNGLVIGTGDLSELALGWCTYNGDHMSMYAVNTGIPKTLVKTLVAWIADTQMSDTAKNILEDVLATPVSPELLPAHDDGQIKQITEDMVGPYVLHDFFLYNMLRFNFEPKKIYFLACQVFINEYTNEIILKWLKVFYRRFFSQQFKRSCIPDGPKVGSINLSPRGDWRMPSDASAKLWLDQLENL